MTNQCELRVVGMSRSGNHAIINWILNQVEGRYCFLNCAEPKTNPYETARPMRDEDVAKANFELDLEAERRGDFSRKDYLLHSYEDCFLGMVAGDAFEKNHDAYVGSSRRRIDVLILRDPFNLFASRRKSSYAVISSQTAVRIWKQHAREVLGRGKYLNQEKLFILYNRWVADESYRRRIASALDLRFTDEGVSEVPAVGQGSSFDGRRFNGEADRMRVLERWRYYKDDPDYVKLLDDELIEFSIDIFGPLSGTDQILSERQEARLEPAD